jgi:hypothetical protein
MKVDVNYLRGLDYSEINLKDIEISVTPSSEDEDDNSCGVGIKGGKPMTEAALKQLCSFLKIPYAFTKQLRANGRTNIITYLQRQLSQSAYASVLLVSDAKTILSIANEEDIHYRGEEAITFDTRLRQMVAEPDSFLELKDVSFEGGMVNYYLFYKEMSSEVEDDSKWKFGFILSFSVIGEVKPTINAVVQRVNDVSMAILPTKTHSYPLDYDSEFAERWNMVAAFIKNPPPPIWLTLGNAITSLKKTTASFREVKEARAKLNKLKVDKDDTETLERINGALQWKKINKEYNIKDMSVKPNKTWYCRASTPLTSFFLLNTVMREAASAPNTVSYEIRKNLFLHAGSLLMGTPDLSASQNPPVIDWDRV